MEKKKKQRRRKTAKVDAQSVMTAEKTQQALSLRCAGGTYRQISAQMGCTISYAFKLVEHALAEIKAETSEKAEETLAIEMERLDRRWRRLQTAHDRIEPRVKSGEDKAILMMLKIDASEGAIMERRAAYKGLDAAKRQELTGANGAPLSVTTAAATPAEAARLVREAFGAQAAKGSPDVSDAEPAVPMRDGGGPVPAESGTLPEGPSTD